MIDPVEEAGRPKSFKVQTLCDLAQQLVDADEAIMGLEVLKMMPSFYREHVPDEVINLKQNILSKMVLATDYAKKDMELFEAADPWERLSAENLAKAQETISTYVDLGDLINQAFCFPRGKIVELAVRGLNEKGIIPHIIEMGPATYWIPHGLKKMGLQFKYKPITLQRIAEFSHKKRIGDVFEDDLTKSEYHIFVCFEVIEHMHNELDLQTAYLSQGIDADMVMISTPLHTYAGGNDDVNKQYEHLRTYSAKEFQKLCLDMFPRFNWFHANMPSQVMCGYKGELPFDHNKVLSK